MLARSINWQQCCDWLGADCPGMQASRVFGVKTRAAADWQWWMEGAGDWTWRWLLDWPRNLMHRIFI